MHSFAIALFSLLILQVSAGPHDSRVRTVLRRRHHARVSAAGPVTREAGSENEERGSTTCTYGSWQCSGAELQRCWNDDWHVIQNCTGDNIICSTDTRAAPGCIWTWSLPSLNSTYSSESSNDTLSIGSETTNSTLIASSVNGSSSVSNTPPPARNSSAQTTSSTNIYLNATTTDDGDEDGDDCDDGDDESTPSSVESIAVPSPTFSSLQTTSSSNTSVTSTNNGDNDGDYDCGDMGDDEPAAASTALAVALPTATSTSSTLTNSTNGYMNGTSIDAGDDEGYDCDGGGDDGDDETSATITPVSVTASATSTVVSSIVGGQLYAGQNASEVTSFVTVSGSTKHHAVSTSTTDDDSWAASSTDSWATVSATASVTASVNVSVSTFENGSSSVATLASTSKHHAKGNGSATTTTSVALPSISAETNSTSGTTSSTPGSYSAPHYVIYADNWLESMPSADTIGQYNRFILAFWMSNQGAVDDVDAWQQFDASYRQQILQEYHDSGIALMISAFGSTDSPTTNGADPTNTAQQLAEFVKNYGLDGVDIDYEDMTAMNSNQAEAWLITFQAELRRQLPSPYIISHAPVAPWFTSASDYSSGAYVSIHQAVGDTIDFYNVQYYNQGDVYLDCGSLITNSGDSWPSTSVMEINSYAGVPLDKIVIGKPLDSGAADNGYMDPSTLAQCVTQANSLGWNAGVMFWEWTDDAPSVIATVRA